MRDARQGLLMRFAAPRIAVQALLWMWLGLGGACAADTLLHEQPSMFGTIVVTEDEQGLRTLRFGRSGPRQSVVKPGDPDQLVLQYTRTAFVGLALADQPRRMLVVGVGGGTLPMFLRKHYPDAAIDAVDIDPNVVDVARRFLGFREDATLRAHVVDGRAFIEAVREPYDVIFLDAFSSSELPGHLTTQEFLRAVRRALAPSGVVVGNIWDRYANRLYDSMIRTYQDSFDELYMLSVPAAGNKILLALPRMLKLSEADIEMRARTVATERRFLFDMGEAATYGFVHVREKNVAGQVLRDAKP
jgi:spermidine synthase